jgi:hypothetical protein
MARAVSSGRVAEAPALSGGRGGSGESSRWIAEEIPSLASYLGIDGPRLEVATRGPNRLHRAPKMMRGVGPVEKRLVTRYAMRPGGGRR